MDKALKDLCVLIADDNLQAVRYYQLILQGLGIQHILTVYNGRDALKLFDETTTADNRPTIDAMICDWVMPEVNGIDILRQVRTAYPELPFIMVTGISDKASVQGAIIHGVTDYLAKPFAPEELERKLLSAIKRHNPAG